MDRSAASADLAFVGGGASGKGVFTDIAGTLAQVATTLTIIPDGTGKFTDFGTVAFDPDSAGNPITAFLGFGSSGQQGIYAQFDGALRKVIDLGDTLDGKTPVSFGFGTSGLDVGRLTFAATFNDGSEGLFTSLLENPSVEGDFNDDGTVDAADYVVWRKGLGTTHTQDDYNTWRANFGQSAGSGAGAGDAAPEPSSLFVLLTAIFALLGLRQPCN